MDSFVEQIVRKHSRGIDYVKKLLVLVATFLVALFLLFVVGGFLPQLFAMGFMASVGVLFGGYYLSSNLNIEYEYLFTNGELDIDKIIAQRKRKRLCTIDVRSFEQFGVYTENVKTDNIATTIVATDNTGVGIYYAIFKHSKLGQTMLLFTPEERFLEAMKTHLPRSIRT